ncbi:MBL fold metallo-hydrolase [Thermoflexus sp.]|uniref:MBL fold metallo-hydrolase n=1 Tax=Thermoflexus sp. TaxID=1969742 RepID=UPI0035E4364A
MQGPWEERDGVLRYRTKSGVEIYRLPIRLFPELDGYVYLILADDHRILVDAGSGLPESLEDLRRGFEILRARYGCQVDLHQLTAILITHGHIDHFGGLASIRQQSPAPVFVHELDRRVLVNYSERLITVAQEIRYFLNQAGVSPERQSALLNLYLSMKALFQSTPVEGLLTDGEMLFGILRVHHTPGHCPGQVCLQIDEVLLTSDHILAHTTPHQAPERITRYTGLGHYLESLRRVAAIPDIALAFGGHEDPILNPYERIAAIEAFHHQRLERVLEICKEPRTIAEVSKALFGRQYGYGVLLALLEAGAHVEYLYDRGYLQVANLDQLENEPGTPIRYRRL